MGKWVEPGREEAGFTMDGTWGSRRAVWHTFDIVNNGAPECFVAQLRQESSQKAHQSFA